MSDLPAHLQYSPTPRKSPPPKPPKRKRRPRPPTVKITIAFSPLQVDAISAAAAKVHLLPAVYIRKAALGLASGELSKSANISAKRIHEFENVPQRIEEISPEEWRMRSANPADWPPTPIFTQRDIDEHTCSHPEEERRNLGYGTICGKCGERVK